MTDQVARDIEAARQERARRRRQRFWVENEDLLRDRAVIEAGELAYYAEQDARVVTVLWSDPLDHEPADDAFCERDPYDDVQPEREGRMLARRYAGEL